MTSQSHSPPASDPADILAAGFGTTVATWLLIYLCQLPHAAVPDTVLLTLVMLLWVAGGALFVRFTGRSLGAAAVGGALVGVLNLLIAFSLIRGEDPLKFRVFAPALPFVLIALTTVTFLAGASVGRTLRRKTGNSVPGPHQARLALGLVAVAATVGLIAIGGVVTGYEAGLAVPDWPNTYGYNMFLYPREKMIGNIFFEHAHRLFGSLVGFTTLVQAIYLTRYEKRRSVRLLGWLAFVLVVGQGVLGALRVTGHFTMSASPEDKRPDIRLAILHGVTAQVFLSLLACLAAMQTRAWRDAAPASPHRTSRKSTDAVLSIVAVAAVLGQITLGALLRHVAWGLAMHITFAAIATVAVVALGTRLWLLYDHCPPLPRVGAALIAIVMFQLILGFGALLATQDTSPQYVPTAFDVLLTTAHQTTGALLLMTTALAAVLRARLAGAFAIGSPGMLAGGAAQGATVVGATE